MAEPYGQPAMVELPAAVSIPSVVGAAQPMPTQSAASASRQKQEEATVASTLQAAVIPTTETATLSDIPMHPLINQNDRSEPPTSNDNATIRGANIPLGDNVTKTIANLGNDNTMSASSDHVQATDKREFNDQTSPLKASSLLVTKSPALHAGGSTDDQVTLELLLLSGSRKRFTFKNSSTINEVLAWTFKDWPSSWEEEKPEDLSQLRLLHRGQFLQGSSRLSSFNISDNAVTVMHLNIRPKEGAESAKPKRVKSPAKAAAAPDSHGGGCCSSCTIS